MSRGRGYLAEIDTDHMDGTCRGQSDIVQAVAALQVHDERRSPPQRQQDFLLARGKGRLVAGLLQEAAIATISVGLALTWINAAQLGTACCGIGGR